MKCLKRSCLALSLLVHLGCPKAASGWWGGSEQQQNTEVNNAVQPPSTDAGKPTLTDKQKAIEEAEEAERRASAAMSEQAAQTEPVTEAAEAATQKKTPMDENATKTPEEPETEGKQEEVSQPPPTGEEERLRRQKEREALDAKDAAMVEPSPADEPSKEMANKNSSDADREAVIAHNNELRERAKEEQARQKEVWAETLAKEKERRAKGGNDYALTLKAIYLSHGDLKPSFTPDHYDYTVDLLFPHDVLAILPEIFQDRPEYAGGADHLPLIQTMWTGSSGDAIAEPTAAAVRRQIDLPDDGSELDITIRVVDPFDKSHSVSYHIKVHQSDRKFTGLRSIQAIDAHRNGVRIEPLPSRDVTTYTAYVAPDTETLTLKTECVGSWVTVDGRSAANKEPVTVVRNLKRHIQVVEIACGRGGLWQEQYAATYFLKVMSDYKSEEIPMPTIVVDEVGEECDKTSSGYECPSPRDAKDSKARVTAFLNPQIRYTVESPDKSVEVRLLNELSSIPFTFSSDLKLHAVAGQFEREWPLVFATAGYGWIYILGIIIGALFAVLLLSMCVILGLSSLMGLGSPLGLPEVASTLTFILQFLCFSNHFTRNKMLNSVTRPVEWITFFWPVPGAKGSIGDLTIANAHGCIFWTSVAFLAAFLIHLAVVARFMLCQKNYTFPHNLALGGLEARVAHWFIFPTITACAMTLKHPEASGWKLIAIPLLLGAIAFVLTSWWGVYRAVLNYDAVWVWGSSLHEVQKVDDSDGFWADGVCDQLATQPATRSFLPCFEWKWSSTVADIEPVHISPETYSRSSDYSSIAEESSSLYTASTVRSESVSTLHTASEACGCQSCHPMAKYPKCVEVFRVRSPVPCCPGARNMVGLFRMQWMDTIMTFQALTVIHDKILEKASYRSSQFSMPMVVKTNQLQGPVTAGRWSFFFDGVKIPFVKVFDCIARLLLGLCIGYCLIQPAPILFGLMGCLAVVCIAYVASTCPYLRRVEAWLYALTLVAVAATSTSLMAHHLSEKVPRVIPDYFLGLTLALCFAMVLYSTVVTTSLFAAFICPPLPEARFVETIANANVCIADHEDGWSVDVPGWSKVNTMDLKVQSTIREKNIVNVSVFATKMEPSIEFCLDDVATACRSGNIRQPIVCAYIESPIDPLGYSAINIFDRSHMESTLSRFLEEEPETRDTAKKIARQITQQINLRGTEKTVFTVTVTNPKFLYRSVGSSHSSTTSKYDSSTADRTSSRTTSSRTTTTSSPSRSSSSKTSSSYTDMTKSETSSRSTPRRHGIEMSERRY